MHDRNRHQELRSFGRRRGRRLSPRQEVLLRDFLPRVALELERPAPTRTTELFATQVGEVWLEIGFGAGEHLLWQAQRNPDIGFIGCEPFVDGIIKALAAIEAGHMRNLRLSTGDAREVLRWLPSSSLTRVFVLFPDPWPKRRHRKRRLVSTPFLAMLARVMQSGAELRIATDVGDYARTMLLAFRAEPRFRWLASAPRDWRERTPDWPPTRYEAKALAAGRCCYYFRFVRV
jgi:tRNA (guanine-N7-)-methyltransferase